ncbi:MAG: MATE family efflux transporter [Tissierellia bacterium]|nr:MATE family efflux transporter [Tissierellia bacterium]
MKRNAEETMILNENLWKVMWKLSWPAVLAMALYGLNMVADAVFVGRFVGEKALSGVSAAYPFTQGTYALGALFGSGTGALLSIAIGEQDTCTKERIVGNVNFLIIISGVFLGGISYFISPLLLSFIGMEGVDFQYANEYLQIILLGSILTLGALTSNMIIRAEGKMKTAAGIMGIALIINIIANYIFMGIFSFGVKGAAWGTNLGLFTGIVLFYRYCHKGRAGFDMNEKKVHRDPDILRQILSLGFPSFITTIMALIQGTFAVYALNKYGGTEDIAFYGMVLRLFNFCITPIYGVMFAIQPVVGINFGAGKYRRLISVYKVFTTSALLLVFPFCLLGFLFPMRIFQFMLPDKVFVYQDVINFRYLMGIIPVLPGVLMALNFLTGTKKPKPATIIGLTRQVLLQIPATLLLPRFFGIPWLYKGYFFIDVSLAIIVFALMYQEFKILGEMEEGMNPLC